MKARWLTTASIFFIFFPSNLSVSLFFFISILRFVESWKHNCVKKTYVIYSCINRLAFDANKTIQREVLLQCQCADYRNVIGANMFWWNMKDPPIDQIQANKTFFELDKNLMKLGVEQKPTWTRQVIGCTPWTKMIPNPVKC